MLPLFVRSESKSLKVCRHVLTKFYCIESLGELPEKLDGRVRPASQNPYPIYDQKFETQFMTRPLHQNPVSDLHYNKFRNSAFRPILDYRKHNL